MGLVTAAAINWTAIGTGIGGSTLLLALLTETGRSVIGRLFKGQSLGQVTQVYADKMAAVESAYNVLNAEYERLKDESGQRIGTLQAENRELRDRVSSLEARVESMAGLDSLFKLLTKNHSEVMAALTPREPA